MFFILGRMKQKKVLYLSARRPTGAQLASAVDDVSQASVDAATVVGGDVSAVDVKGALRAARGRACGG